MVFANSVSYHHPLEEGLGQLEGHSKNIEISKVSYHHPLEEGLGRNPHVKQWLGRSIVSYHHPLEEGLGLIACLARFARLPSRQLPSSIRRRIRT